MNTRNCNCRFYDELTDALSACLTRHNYRCPRRKKRISCKERNAKFTCTVEPNEIACLFVVDPKHKGNCRNGRPANCLRSKNSCDFIFFINTGNQENLIRSVTFIELKGNKTGHAVEQIKETIKVFIRKFPKSRWRYKIFAVIIYSGSAPRGNNKDKELKKLLDKFPFLKRRNEEDITSYVKTI